MVAISGSSKSKSKSKRIRVLMALCLLLFSAALLVGFVLQNLHMSIVKQHQNSNINHHLRSTSSHESHQGLRIPSDHAHLQQQQEQQQEQRQQKRTEPDDDNDTEPANFVEEAPENTPLDDDDGAEDEAEEEEVDEDEAEAGNDTEQEKQRKQQQVGDDGNIGGDDGGMRQEEEQQGAADAICPYGSLSELTRAERYPHADDGTKRHMVDPPQGGKVSLVCCMTTAGPWNFVIRHAWAPLVSSS
jgi:hypothetical protein